MAKRKRVPEISCQCGPVKIGKSKLYKDLTEFYFPTKCRCRVNGKSKLFDNVHIVSWKK